MSEESKVIIAMRKFASDYSWDKSLHSPLNTNPMVRAEPHVSSSECIADFVRAQQAGAQSDHL